MEGGAYLPTFCVTFHLKYLPNRKNYLMHLNQNLIFCACQNFPWDPITRGNIGRFEIMDLIFANFSNIFCRLCNEYFRRTFCTIRHLSGQKIFQHMIPRRCASSKLQATDWLITEDSGDASAFKNSCSNQETTQNQVHCVWISILTTWIGPF